MEGRGEDTPHIVIVHDGREPHGGAERVAKELQQAFPSASTIGLPSLNHYRLLRRAARATLLPLRTESLDIPPADIVISCTSSYAKGVITLPQTLHVCYCHTPTRFLWDSYHAVLRGSIHSRPARTAFALVAHAHRLWDLQASRRVDLFIANSRTTRDRIRHHYRRDALVIPPPNSLVLPSQVPSRQDRSYFLFVGRLTTSKRPHLVVETFNKLELPLVVVGGGRELKRLKRLARPPVVIRGPVDDEELCKLYQGARAVVFPSEDDFGLVPIEALSCGTPVLALRRGGATETIEEGVTGEFFDAPVEELLADSVRRFLIREHAYEPARLQHAASRYSPERFRAAVRHVVFKAWRSWQIGHNLVTEDHTRSPLLKKTSAHHNVAFPYYT